MMRFGSLITADADADGVDHEQQHQGCAAVDPGIGDHGWNGRTGARYRHLPPWSTLVEPDPRTPASASVQRIELTPHQVPERVVHVVKACVLVWLALVVVALQL